MARIVHVALKVEDLDRATQFYEELFGFRQTGTGYARGHVSRHMTDGALDMALMVYDNEEVHEAQLSGPGPCIHHWGIEVEDRDATQTLIEENGGEIISKPGEGALKFRAPNGTIAEIVRAGRYKTISQSDQPRVVRLAIQVEDLESSTRFYEKVFGFKEVPPQRRDPQAPRQLTDGNFDLVLLSSGDQGPDVSIPAGSKIHHLGIAVADPESFPEKIARHGGTVLSKAGAPTITYRAPDGTLAEILSSAGAVQRA